MNENTRKRIIIYMGRYPVAIYYKQIEDIPQDGQRLISYLEEKAIKKTARDASSLIQKTKKRIADQLLDYIWSRGKWPVLTSVMLVPIMQQNEEHYPEKLREKEIDLDILYYCILKV